MFKTINSIKGKLIIAISILIILVVAGTAATLYKQSAEMMEESIFINAQESARQNSAIVSEWLFGMENFMLDQAGNSNVQSMMWQFQEQHLAGVENPNIENLFVAQSDGSANVVDGGSLDVADREYFQQVMESGEIYFSSAIESRISGNHVITIAAPILSRADEVQGILAGTVTTQYLQNLINEMTINGVGYGWIIDQNKRTIAYPEREYIGTQELAQANDDLISLSDRMVAGESGAENYNFAGDEKIMAFHPVGLNGWSVAMTADRVDVMSALINLRDISLIIAIAALILGIIVAVIIANYIANPINYITELAEKLAAGDFTMKIEQKYKERKDEVGKLTIAFSEMINNLKEMILDVKNLSDKVSASSEELSANGKQVGESADDVGRAIQEVASNTEEQSAQVEETSANMDELINQITMINTSSAAMDRQAVDVMGNIKKGNKSLENSIGEVNKVKDNSARVEKAIHSLADSSARIGEIVDLIRDISSQTNLLALNAAIEAARAGEAGRGFSVVAEEIRELAEQSNKATAEISDLIDGIQNDVNASVENMEETGEVVTQSVNSIEDSGQAFVDIEKTAQILKNIITNINNKAEEMAANSDNVERAIREIASASETAAANAEEVAASSQEQNAVTEEIISASNQLAEMADELSQSISKFKLE